MSVLLSVFMAVALVLIYAAAVNAYALDFNVVAYYLKMRSAGYSVCEAYQLVFQKIGANDA